MQTDKRFWETSEVDLNLRHYSGHPSDAIKLVKRNIEKYLRKIRDNYLEEKENDSSETT